MNKHTTSAFLILAASTLMAWESFPMQMWLTGSVHDTPTRECAQDISPEMLARLQSTKPFMTDDDMLNWGTSPKWKPKPTMRSKYKSMLDQCFVLRAGREGESLLGGVIISVHSARMYHTPTIAISDRNHTLGMELRTNLKRLQDD